MPDLIRLSGVKEPVTLFGPDDFADLLRERLGSDAADWFRRELSECEDHADECERAYLQNSKRCEDCAELEELRTLIDDIDDLAREAYTVIMDSTSRRTKTEQSALDRILEILRLTKQGV